MLCTRYDAIFKPDNYSMPYGTLIDKCAQSTDGSRLYDSVINSVLSAVERDPKNVDIDADCDVCWRFFLPMQGRGLFPSKALKDMLTRGVLHINPGEQSELLY